MNFAVQWVISWRKYWLSVYWPKKEAVELRIFFLVLFWIFRSVAIQTKTDYPSVTEFTIFYCHLRCHVESAAPVSITWRPTSRSQDLATRMKPVTTGRESTLVISNFQKSDQGRYVCLARNDYGQGRDDASVYAKSKSEHELSSTTFEIFWNVNSKHESFATNFVINVWQPVLSTIEYYISNQIF